MKIQDLKLNYPEYYNVNKLILVSSDGINISIDNDFLEKSIRQYYISNPKIKPMKYQFKEGDGSHRDMTIEQCNLVLDRLRKQGYEVSGEPCNKQYPHFCV